jgi:hypothetical protein
MSKMDEVRQRATRGALLLDQKHPGWENEINLEKFEIQNQCLCVLGQLYRSFANGANTLFGSMMYRNLVVDHGFDSGSGPDDLTVYRQFNLLQEAWVEEIKNRQSPPASWTHREKEELATLKKELTTV